MAKAKSGGESKSFLRKSRKKHGRHSKSDTPTNKRSKLYVKLNKGQGR